MFKNFALASAFVMAGLFAQASQAAPIVRLIHAGPTVTVDSTFTISLTIEDTVDLFGWEMDLSYTPAANTEVLAQTTGSFFGGGDTFIEGTVDAMAGVISLIAAAFSGTTGVTGSGVLAELTFKALDVGSLDVKFDRVLLLDSVNNNIFIENDARFGTSLSVMASEVPLPGSLALVVLALVLIPAVASRAKGEAPFDRCEADPGAARLLTSQQH